MNLDSGTTEYESWDNLVAEFFLIHIWVLLVQSRSVHAGA
jgi:hypothetical protein